MSEEFPENSVDEAARRIVGDPSESQPNIDISPEEARLRKLLAPMPAELRAGVRRNFDFLFAEVDDRPPEDRAGTPEWYAKNRRLQGYRKRFSVTDQSVQEALDRLSNVLRDEQIRAAVEAYAAAHGISSVSPEIARALREDEELRFLVGKRLQDIAQNTTSLEVDRKAMFHPRYPGYHDEGKMTSHEYAGLLALAKIDGTYKEDSRYESSQDGRHRRLSDKVLARVSEL